MLLDWYGEDGSHHYHQIWSDMPEGDFPMVSSERNPKKAASNMVSYLTSKRYTASSTRIMPALPDSDLVIRMLQDSRNWTETFSYPNGIVSQ
jgi:hypothetical protein